MLSNLLRWTGLIFLCVLTEPLAAQNPTPSPESSQSLDLKTWPQLYIADADGNGMRRLTTEATTRHEQSPSISQDGKLLVFSGYDTEKTKRASDSMIYLLNLETGEEQEICKGVTPSLSPRAKRLFYSRYDDRGVWVSDLENPKDTATRMDNRGWGAEWSPNGKLLAWANYERGYNLKIFDIIEGEEWTVFEGERSPFRTIYYNFAWSPDSANIAFKGISYDRKSHGLFAVSIAEEREPILLMDNSGLHHAMDWHPDGSKILFSQKDPELKHYRLYTMEPLKPDTDPVPLLNMPPEVIATEPCYTPDGSQIVFAAAVKPDEKDANQKNNVEKKQDDLEAAAEEGK